MRVHALAAVQAYALPPLHKDGGKDERLRDGQSQGIMQVLKLSGEGLG